MDYGAEDDGAFGNIPEFGAIFMSNLHTKKECLKRKIFALPSSHAEFVTRIKAGMVLFLFEFRRRQLFGVFQASSDGAVDIVPHAFNYSGQRFPAQVRFRQIWHCDPLSEKEFRDAIRENYFSANQFNFGLSKDQVRRLLCLFSSRKMKSRIPPHPRSEAIVGVAVKDRRWLGEDRHELSERGYMAAAEYDGINTVAFSDHHVSSLARGQGNEVMVDDRVNAEGKEYPFHQDDFLAKKRRIGKESRYSTNNVAENGLYSHGYRRTFCSDSSKDSLDEVRSLTESGRLLAAQMVNENQVDKIHNPVQSSEHFLDQLDVRALDDYAFMRRSTLSEDYNTHDGYQQAFASDHYGDFVGQSKHVSNDDRFLLDDCVKRDCNFNVVSSMVNSSDDNLNSCRQARDMVEDHEWLMNRKLENRHHLDCDDSTYRAFDHSANPLHKIRKTTAVGRFQIDENQPDFGTCSVEGFPSKNILRPLQCSYRNIEDRNYPIVDGRSTENMVDKVPPILATSAGYIANADRRTVEGRFGNGERVDNPEASHTHTNPVMSMKYPSFSQVDQNLSSFSDKLFPEKHLSQLTVSHNFDLLHSTFDDATITRAVPYLPDHPNLSRGCSASTEANQNSTSMQKNRPHGGSLGNFYPPYSNRSQQYILESEKSSRPLDIGLEFGNKGFARSTSGLQSSSLRESTNSFVNPNFFLDMDLNTSAPVNYSESEDLGMAICQPESDFAIYENRHFKFSSNMHLKELHKTSGANSTFNRRSVFTRLSSKESSRFGEERNDIHVNHQDCYMDATADEVMEMLQQDDDLSLRKLRKSRVVGQPRESAVNEKKTQCNMETDYSTMEKKKLKTPSQTTDHSTVEKIKLKDASQTTADSMDDIPKETRTLDFKRRRDSKNLVAIAANSASHSKPTGADEEAKSSTSSTLRRKKLVRPVFSKTVTAVDATCGNETLLIPALIPVKDDKQSCGTPISLLESEIPNDITGSSYVLGSQTCQEMDCNKELLYPEEQNDVVAHVLPSTSIDLKGHEQANDDLHIGSSKVLKETSKQKNLDIPTSVECILAKDTDTTIKETSQQKSLDIQTSVEGVLAKDTDTDTIKETSELKSLDIQTSLEGVLANDTGLNLPESSLEGFKLGVGCGNSLTEEKHFKKMKIILTTKTDVKASSQ